jgi:Holliday junction resolvase RusA-like endonuclease
VDSETADKSYHSRRSVDGVFPHLRSASPDGGCAGVCSLRRDSSTSPCKPPQTVYQAAPATDILSLSLALGSSYPSVNHTGKDGFRGGRKSDAYKKLFTDVETAARSEIERTGWAIASTECALTVVRYIPDRRRTDASNLAKVECDALTKAGVWIDDRLANPCSLAVRYDPAGPHRIVIIVVKLYYPSCDASATCSEGPVKTLESSRRSQRMGKSAVPSDSVDRWRPGDPIPRGMADLNGRLVTRQVALEKAGLC